MKKRKPPLVTVELVMRDHNGVIAVACAEMQAWINYNIKDAPKMAKFTPTSVLSVTVGHPNGWFKWPA